MSTAVVTAAIEFVVSIKRKEETIFEILYVSMYVYLCMLVL